MALLETTQINEKLAKRRKQGRGEEDEYTINNHCGIKEENSLNDKKNLINQFRKETKRNR